MANINSVITYNANLSPAQAQIKALTGQIAGLTSAFNNLNKSALATQRQLATAFSRDVGNIGGFTAQMVSAHNAVESFGKQLATNRLTMREYFREAVAGYTKQNSLMQQLAAQQVRYQQSVAVPMGAGQMMMLTPQTLAATGTSAALAAERFSIFNKLVDGGATSMLNWGKNTQWAGRQLMVGFTVPLAMFTALASKQFRELDKELTRFQKVYGSDLGGAVSEATDRMRENVKQLAFDISRTYGIAAKDTAALAADIAATGQEGQALLESVQQTTRLAVLGEVDRQEAMKATLSLQSAFRLNTNELAESINFLNAVENQTSATLEDLATAIPKVGPIVRSLGGDVRDLATLLVAMREGGIPAAEAANALKSGLAALINPTKQASEVAKKFGVDLVGIVEGNRGQLMPTLYEFQGALENLDSFSRSRIIEQIFGKYQFARISALFDNLGRLGSQTQAVVELAAQSSAELAATANQEIRVLTESTAVRFQRTLEELKNAIMPIGQTLTETLIPILSFIGEGIKTFSGFFQSLPGPIKDFAKLGVAIAALAGPVIMLVGLFGNLIANGIKFGMMVTRLGAKMMGFKVQPFELLNEQLMAARFGVDNLTTAFTTQETAMNRLVGVMTRYTDSLARIRSSSPELFITGALPGPGGRTPVKRQTGGIIPGYGGGDIVPAYLEPGEFVIRKEATRQNRAFLEAINSGKESGRYEKGRSSASGSGQGSISRPAKLHTVDPRTLHQMFYGKEGMLAAIGYGGMTSTVHPQSINGTFEALRQAGVRMPQWMASGIPFNDSAVGQMIEVLERERSAGTVKVGRQYLHALAYLKRLEKTPGLARYRTLMGYALTTASSERMTGIISNNDSAQKKRIQQLYAYLDQKVSSGATPAQIFRTINNESIKYLDAATTGKLLPGMSRKDTGINLQKAGNLFAVSESSSNMESFKDNLRRQLPKGAQTTTLWQQLLFGRYRKMQTGGISQGEPALLEPGEFIVNSEASRKNANILHAMNMGKVRGYEFGRSQNLPGETTLPSGLVIPGSAAPAATGATGETVKAHLNRPITVPASSLLGLQGLSDSARASLLAITANGDVLVRVFSNLVVALQKTTNSALNTGNAMASTVSAELKSAAAWEIITRNTGLTMQDLQPTILRVTDQLDNLGNELIDDPRLYQIIETELTQLAAAGDRAAIVLQTLGTQYGAMADPNDPRRHRMDLGAGVAPSYRTERTGTGTPLHMLPYVDLRRYEVDERGGRVALPMADAAGTGPGRAMQNDMDRAMRGQNLMNVAFIVPMLISSFAMAGAASEDLASKLSMLSMVIMGLATLPMLRGMGGAVKGVGTNFLGLGSLGRILTEKGAAKQAAVPVSAASKYAASSSLGRAFAGMPHMAPAAGAAAQASKAGSGLLMAGRIASIAGGPVGIAAGIGITAAIAGFMAYRNAAEEARNRAIAAFNDPVKSAEYFGETLLNVSDIIEQNRLSNISEDLEGVDQALRDVVKQDYAPLIEQIKYLSAGAGAQALSAAYSNMIVSGMSAESAKATIEAIATEAGMRGGEAFNEALQKGLLRNQTIQQAVNNIVGQFTPSQTEYGNTGLTLQQKIEEDIAAVEKRIQEIQRTPIPSTAGKGAAGAGLQLYGEELARLNNELDALRDRLEDLQTVNPEMVIPVLEALTMAYAQDPGAAVEGMQDFVAGLSRLTEDDRLAAMSKMVDFLVSGYGEEWSRLGKTVNEHNEQIAATQMLIQGISLEHAINSSGEFDIALANAATSAKMLADEAERAAAALESQVQEEILSDLDKRKMAVETEVRDIEDATTKIIKSYNKRRREYQNNFDLQQEASQDSIDAMQDEMDTRRESFDQEMDQLDKRTEAIQKSSDAYIESLQKNKEADSFYAQQKKTSLGALEKLASGDVFGFLQEREQMSADAQQFSYDQMISGIEERRDLELEIIDETRQKRQDEQQEYEKMMNDRIDAIQNQMDAEQELYDDKMQFFDKEVKTAERVRDKKITAKRDELDTINEMIETANSDILEFQRKFAEDYDEIVDPYERQLNNLKVLKTQEIYYRGGVPLSVAANRAGVPASQVPDFLDQNREQFGFYVEGGGRGGQGRNIIPTNAQTYKFSTTTLPDTEEVIRNVQNMTVDAQNVTINGDILPGGADGDTRTPIATGGYINNGKVERLQGGGGAVRGPGGPKSDVIPALLSNGEYVIQASSVGKYGKDMMDSINAGKFAYGGFITADRAEQNATGARGKPKLTGIGGGNFGRPGVDYPRVVNEYNPQDPTGLKGFVQGIRTAAATIVDSFAAPFKNPLGIRTSSDQTTALGRFIGGRGYIQSDPLSRGLSAMSIIPIGGVSGRSGRSPLDANARAAKYFPDMVAIQSPVKGLYDPLKDDPLILNENPSSPFAQTSVRDSYLDNIFFQAKGDQGGISPGGFVVGKDNIERYVKSPQSGIPQAAYSEVFTTKLYEMLGFSVPKTSLLRLGAEGRAYKLPTPLRYRSNPFADDPSMFKPGSLVVSSQKLKFDPLGGSDAPELLAREQGFGTAMDQWLHFTDMHPGNFFFSQGKAYRMDFGSNPFYSAAGRPINPEIFTNQSWIKVRDEYQGYPSISPAEISDQWRVLSNAIQNRGGLGKLVQLVSDDILGITGIELSNKSSVVSLLESRLREGLKLTENPSNMSITNLPPRSFSGLYANGGLIKKYADGGIVKLDQDTPPPNQGLSGVFSLLRKKEEETSGGMPGVGGTGSPTDVQPTSTNLINHPSQGGPNQWPYANYPQASGRIPGSNLSVSLNKDVLPLFLAFASDYNRLIRPISTIYGIGAREGNYSNHPSGTAVDINPSEEGQYFGWGQSLATKQAVLNWWRGQKSTAAPWKSISPIPYKTVNSLMSKYKILQWFGPTSLGGFITDEMGNSDPMHFQITQSRTVSPSEVAKVTSELGINPDGTFNRPTTYARGGMVKRFAAGGFISGPGGPRSDMIPAMLSNGEYVVKADAVNKYGKGFMDRLNAGNVDFSTAQQFANGGLVGATPTFGLPQMASVNPANISANVNNNIGGSRKSMTRNSSKVNVVINGAGGKSANAIANKVISMINQANSRRNHSRSAG